MFEGNANVNTGGKTQNIDFKQDIELLTDWALQVYTSVLQILKLCFECKQVFYNCLNVSDLQTPNVVVMK